MQGTNASTWQVFGTRKCAETRKAQRFFKERGIKIHEVDLGERAMSPGELRSVASQMPTGWQALLDREGDRYKNRGLAHSLLGDAEIERLLSADPALLRTPIVRCGKRATVGYAPDVWQAWLRGS